MPNRRALRQESAGKLNTLSQEQLNKAGISRVSEITWLDTIGIPVWKSTVPNAHTISINSGKGLDRMLARAGAIAEAIEFKALEGWVGQFIFNSYRQLSVGTRIPDFPQLPLCSCSQFNIDSMIPWEFMQHLFENRDYYLPSEAIYTRKRIPYPFNFFDTGSNGAAGAGTIPEALLVALYELIERDAMTCAETRKNMSGEPPAKIDLENSEGPIRDAIDRIIYSGSKLSLFDLTSDIGIRVFAAFLFDLETPEVGVFSGFGCSCDPIEAAMRAITEACLSRCGYIDGARDDFLRRPFQLIKGMDQRKAIEYVESIPYSGEIQAYIPMEFDSVESEIEWVKSKLAARGLTNIFWKLVGDPSTTHVEDFYVVKTVSLDLEMPLSHLWKPRSRSLAIISEAAKAQAGNAPDAAPPDNDG